MTNTGKQAIIINFRRLTDKIDLYRRKASDLKKLAFDYAECGYRESAQFSKGQAFAFGCVADDLQIILDSLNDLLSFEVTGGEAPSCLASPAIAVSLERSLPREEVPHD